MLPAELEQERKRRGEIFHRLRISQKINLMQMCRLTGLARQTIRKIEAGRTAWNIDTEIILTRVLNVNKTEGFIEICQESGKIISLKITGVMLDDRSSVGI